MENVILKTIKWPESKALFTTLASQSFGNAKNSKPADFNEFIASYPMVLPKRMFNFFDDATKRNEFKDVTHEVTAKEDLCLLSAENATAIEIMLRYLNRLDAGEKIWPLWCYLDTEKKAVVHFLNKGGWYAEGYFSSKEEFSALHLISTDEKKVFIPTVFAKDISKFSSKAILTGGHCLQDYLPRVKGDFLSRGGRKNGQPAKHETQNGKKHTYSHMPGKDNWDGL